MSTPSREQGVGGDCRIRRRSWEWNPAGEMTADLPQEEGQDGVDGVYTWPKGQEVKLKRPHLKAAELDKVDLTGNLA